MDETFYDTSRAKISDVLHILQQINDQGDATRIRIGWHLVRQGAQLLASDDLTPGDDCTKHEARHALAALHIVNDQGFVINVRRE